MHFSQTAAATGGELLEITAQYAPHSNKPPLHFHPHQHEHFAIASGSMTVIIGEERRVFRAGETFDVPPGTPHAMRNAGDEPTSFTWQIRPALNSQAFFETTWGLAEAGKVGAKGTPNLLQAAVLMQGYRDVFRLVSPPPAVQRILFGLLAPLGRLLGYRTYYDEYRAAG